MVGSRRSSAASVRVRPGVGWCLGVWMGLASWCGCASTDEEEGSPGQGTLTPLEGTPTPSREETTATPSDIVPSSPTPSVTATPLVTPDDETPPPLEPSPTPASATPEGDLSPTPASATPEDDSSPTPLEASPTPVTATPPEGAGSPTPTRPPDVTPEPTLEPTPTPEPLPEPDAITGVLIVGAGPAGLAAGIEAQDADVPFLILDLDSVEGGSCRYSGGMMLFAGTPEQQAAGIDDSPEALLAEWPEMTGGDPELPWVQHWIQDAVPQVHDWLTSFGVRFTLEEALTDCGSVMRVHRPDGIGGAVVEALYGQLLDPETVQLNHQVTRLITSGGQVLGAEYTDLETGHTGWIQAGAVVMATGGFLRDLNRVYLARPDLDGIELWFSTSPKSQGLGIELLEDLGATTLNLGAVGLYAHGSQDYRRLDTHEELFVNGLQDSLWVNADGERFVNENDYLSFTTGDAVVNQPDGIAWAAFDADNYGELEMSDPLIESSDPPSSPEDPPTLEEALAAAPEFYLEAQSLDELATAMGIDPTAFEDTVALYNTGEDGSDAFGKPPEHVHPLDHPPFYAVRVVPVVAKGFGGITVNADGVVLDPIGLPMDRLYAAGELTGMAGGSMVDDDYFIGSLSAVVYSGRVAGRSAAAAALR